VETQPVGHPHQLGQRLRPHLSYDLPAVDLDGHFAYVERSGDLLVQLADDDESHDLPFALRQ
jgi:hypothetical protein